MKVNDKLTLGSLSLSHSQVDKLVRCLSNMGELFFPFQFSWGLVGLDHRLAKQGTYIALCLSKKYKREE